MLFRSVSQSRYGFVGVAVMVSEGVTVGVRVFVALILGVMLFVGVTEGV